MLCISKPLAYTFISEKNRKIATSCDSYWPISCIVLNVLKSCACIEHMVLYYTCYMCLFCSLQLALCISYIYITTLHPDTSTATQPVMAGAQRLTNWWDERINYEKDEMFLVTLHDFSDSEQLLDYLDYPQLFVSVSLNIRILDIIRDVNKTA